jgi:hypothetical protein
MAQSPSPAGFASAVELALVLVSPGAAASLEAVDPRLLPDLPAGSLRAQPLPLKCTVSGAKAFLMAPPHFEQAVGPGPCNECTTSTRWPHFVQT